MELERCIHCHGSKLKSRLAREGSTLLAGKEKGSFHFKVVQRPLQQHTPGRRMKGRFTVAAVWHPAVEGMLCPRSHHSPRVRGLHFGVIHPGSQQLHAHTSCQQQ
ncbi:hypothetical protein VIGAN_08353000 [Vigna angularis var. angularis]|uniref:Uncharacterized protein n=1 Tax=Vigna angularis var. angularis TaxID=157739 RepID=A0A0S3SUP9_PHAAN|nr:hypothetical protein VIGAN_08353000 [Vigna angularis var. angularis]